MSRISYRCAVFCAAAVSAFAHSTCANAAMLFLSTHSSDETPASVLNAMFEFDVSGSTLTFTAHNQTAAPNAYKINELYFNGAGDVTGLTPVSIPTGWTFHTGLPADGFGIYDFALIDGVGTDPAQIDPDESASFVFTIQGAGAAEDFVSKLSSIPPGETPALAAAKFVQGPNDDSAWGAVVPAPGAAAVLLAGLAGLTRRRRPPAPGAAA